ncbi:MAG TPA: peptidase S41 [Algoriphagus sp.]|jgi:carboxyl-terminal processing protease|uniref:S41 family peptidase n=1 Tax=unclassified Algoriphagus TaxID=2641541 RepID=UPI000C62CDEB|nr:MULTISPECIES: S41 family peptidase [unclassified Algoriphagus]MAL13948.1 peptidase S41 [Algoriphagus sp.]MAN86908.1 peptidase S41 [Algoriphagus sp.]QYH37304.1 S41 family peptidase [Algoriphagus sp. NBT04N3]HAS59998.1 peptidase S41 [Algoriphagus sp.]HCB47178.1 peptidase S41 [Algoriphagus sp.]
MSNQLKRYMVIILCGGLLLTGFFAFKAKNDKLFALAKNIDIFATLVRELDSYYVDEIDPDELVSIGINAMLEELDPYTEYVPEEESADFRMLTTGEYAGIGALIGGRGEGNIIIMPYTGFPAQSAGLKIADQLLKVDSVDVSKKNTSEVSDLLKGPANTPVKIKVKRNLDTLEFNLVRKKISLKNVPYYGKLDEKTGYIKLGDFTTNASLEVRNALIALKNQGAEKLVLDLRDNPGGLLSEAVEIVNLFIPKGKEVVKTIGKLENVNFTYKTTKTPLDKDIPLVVLINERSASASEIVAGALQDYDRAVLIGRKSFGKGLVQTTIPLTYNAQMKVTTAKYYIPSGRCIQAIDYAQTRENGEVYSIPDSLRKEFKTKNGRIVRDGAGIEPDEMIESKTYAPITYSLVARNHVFDYATEYFYKHPSIGKPREFSITDQEYQNFIKWLEGKEYDYTTYLEKSVSDMKKNAEKAPYYNEIKDQIEALEKRVNHSKEQDLITYKDEVKKVISEEIVSRYYFQEGMIEAGLLKDKDVLKALEVIKQPSELGKILTASAK